MADEGWVPVPGSETMTEEEFEAHVEGRDQEFRDGFVSGFAAAGGQFIPEPVEAALTRVIFDEWQDADDAARIAEIILTQFTVTPKSEEEQ